MDAWGASKGEAIHTQTFLGNPVGCAMGLAALAVVVDEQLPERANRLGTALVERLGRVPGVHAITGRGLMLGIHVERSLGVTRALLERGWIILPCGEQAEALGFTPPLTIADETVDAFVRELESVL